MSPQTRPHQPRTVPQPSGLRLGERLRQLRVAAGLTQSDLAGDRFSKEYVSQIERGKTRPTRETIDWLAERLGVDAGFLANGVSDDQRGRVDAALSRAEALLEKGDDEAVLEEIDECRSAVLSTGLPELEVRALSTEAYARMRQGEVHQAIEHLNRARTMTESELFSWRSRCYQRQRDLEAAREDAERALELAEALDDRKIVANAYYQASLIADREGHWVLARNYAERAKAYYEEVADRANLGRIQNTLGGMN